MENKMGIKILTQGLRVNVRTIYYYYFFCYCIDLSPSFQSMTEKIYRYDCFCCVRMPFLVQVSHYYFCTFSVFLTFKYLLVILNLISTSEGSPSGFNLIKLVQL